MCLLIKTEKSTTLSGGAVVIKEKPFFYLSNSQKDELLSSIANRAREMLEESIGA